MSKSVHVLLKVHIPSNKISSQHAKVTVRGLNDLKHKILTFTIFEWLN